MLAAVLPAQLLLPAVGVLLVATGMATAAGLYLAGFRLGRDGHHAWDIAALMVFSGFAATILADAGGALTALDELTLTFTSDK
jgi:hypothetical protein